MNIFKTALLNQASLTRIPKGWEVRSIESLCVQVTSGGTPLRSNPVYWTGGTIPWLKTSELKDAYVYEAEEKITEEGLANSSAKLFPVNTVLMAMYGDGRTITSLAILGRGASTNQACCAMIADPTKCHYRYLFYALKYHRNQLIGLATGSSQRNLSGQKIKQFGILVPPLPTQQRIATILSAYDDLIENNTRRIAILEEMARLIYREWFVHFRFPGHENVRLVESEVGPVPEGWEVKPFSKAAEFNPSIQVDREIEKPFVEMADLSTSSMNFGYTQTRTGGSGSKFQNGDTLFPRITPSVENGKRGFVQFLRDGEAALGSTEFIVLRSKSLCPEYIYFLSCESDFRDHAAKSMVGASGRQRVQNQCFDSYLIAQPPSHLLTQFSQTVAPMFKIIHTLSSKNANLRRTRDLLLPRLISGEVDVAELEIITGE